MTTGIEAAQEAPAKARRVEPDWLRRRGPGWAVVMRKELAEGLTSLRFVILLGLLALAAAVPIYAASSAIRDAAEGASGVGALFLALFTIGADPVPSFVALVGFVAPLLGIAFGFDAINGERAQGTLPRLLSQPIHRDDVINGKFAAGLAMIAAAVTGMMLLVAGLGILRLGIVPAPSEVVRLIGWLILTIVYVGLWLAFATLCSVLVRRAATSALIAIGVWLRPQPVRRPPRADRGGGDRSERSGRDRDRVARPRPARAAAELHQSRHALQPGNVRAPQPERHRGDGSRPRSAGPAQPADPDPAVARSEPARRLAADRDPRRPDDRAASPAPTSRSCGRRSGPEARAATGRSRPAPSGGLRRRGRAA